MFASGRLQKRRLHSGSDPFLSRPHPTSLNSRSASSNPIPYYGTSVTPKASSAMTTSQKFNSHAPRMPARGHRITKWTNPARPDLCWQALPGTFPTNSFATHPAETYKYLLLALFFDLPITPPFALRLSASLASTNQHVLQRTIYPHYTRQHDVQPSSV
jgi:hypothetical protein